jgi:indole-3-glycerol phosphate synthase
LQVGTYLDAIIAVHRARAAADDRDVGRAMRASLRVEDPPPLVEALIRPAHEPVRVIAEVKRRSPSKVDLAPDLDPGDLGAAYASGGAAAISVLTDGPHFGGDPADVAAVRARSALPVLRKDFTVAPLDVADARAMGASGVLLIVSALSKRELRELLAVADSLGLAALVEVHDADELHRALDVGASVVGVNQRDLQTFEVNATRAVELAAEFSEDVVTVAESGISTREDAIACAQAGYDALLVGEALVTSPDPAAAVALLASAGAIESVA